MFIATAERGGLTSFFLSTLLRPSLETVCFLHMDSHAVLGSLLTVILQHCVREMFIVSVFPYSSVHTTITFTCLYIYIIECEDALFSSTSIYCILQFVQAQKASHRICYLYDRSSYTISIGAHHGESALKEHM